MCIAVIGGMDRLERHYRKEAERSGVELRVFNRSEANIEAKLKHVDALVIFTNKVSHQVKIEAIKAVKARSVPVVLQHSCGVCTFRNCLRCLVSCTAPGTGLEPTLRSGSAPRTPGFLVSPRGDSTRL